MAGAFHFAVAEAACLKVGLDGSATVQGGHVAILETVHAAVAVEGSGIVELRVEGLLAEVVLLVGTVGLHSRALWVRRRL